MHVMGLRVGRGGPREQVGTTTPTPTDVCVCSALPGCPAPVVQVMQHHPRVYAELERLWFDVLTRHDEELGVALREMRQVPLLEKLVPAVLKCVRACCKLQLRTHAHASAMPVVHVPLMAGCGMQQAR